MARAASIPASLIGDDAGDDAVWVVRRGREGGGEDDHVDALERRVANHVGEDSNLRCLEIQKSMALVLLYGEEEVGAIVRAEVAHAGTVLVQVMSLAVAEDAGEACVVARRE